MLILIPMLTVLSLIVAAVISASAGSEHLSSALVALGSMAVVAVIARLVSNEEDRKWLPTLILAGFGAKLVGSWVRWWVLVDYYNGSGDATGFYGAGERLAPMWRAGTPPDMSIGTPAMDGITGLVFVPGMPSFLGAFFLFATFSFIGQIFLYAAFRKSVVPRRLKLYAVAVFFVPTVVYWPSSLGKESVMLLGIGMAAYGISLLLNEVKPLALIPIVGGFVIAGIIRPHISAMMCVGATLALLFARKGAGIGAYPFKRLLLLGVVGSGLAVLMFVAAANFNINLDDGLDTSQVDSFVERVEDQTAKGGSSVDGGFITNPAQFPEAAIRVLFRPLPHEAHNPPALASSLEGTLMLLVTIWKLPAMLRRGRKIRRDPYMIFCVVFIIAFVIAFSAFLNLGLMARERSMIVPFLLAVLVALGWGPPAEVEAAEDEDEDRTEAERDAGIEDLLSGAPVGMGVGVGVGS